MLHVYNNRCPLEDAFGTNAEEDDNMDEDENLDLKSYLFCDQKHETVECCMVTTIDVILRMLSELMLMKKITWMKMKT